MGKPSGRLLGVQIKAGESYFRSNNVVFYADKAHMSYWANHILPIILVLHDPKSQIILWQWAHPNFANETDKGWQIAFPSTNVLKNSRILIETRGVSDPEFARRQRFAADRSFMREFVGHEAYVTIDIWLNKSLSIREIEFRFDDPDKEQADFVVPVEVTWGYDADEVMRHFFPWLEYYDDGEAQEMSGEIERHKFDAVLSPVAKAFLLAEEYFEQGRNDCSDVSAGDDI
jgi:hypothetical protein